MSYIIQTSELSKSFKKSIVVDKVNLNVKKGEIYGFIGQNGWICKSGASPRSAKPNLSITCIANYTAISVTHKS